MLRPGKARQGRVNRLRWANGNNFRGLWFVGGVSSCLVTSPGLIKAVEYPLLGCLGRETRDGSALVSLRIKDLPSAEAFACSKTRLTLRGSVSPQPERFF